MYVLLPWILSVLLAQCIVVGRNQRCAHDEPSLVASPAARCRPSLAALETDENDDTRPQHVYLGSALDRACRKSRSAPVAQCEFHGGDPASRAVAPVPVSYILVWVSNKSLYIYVYTQNTYLEGIWVM